MVDPLGCCLLGNTENTQCTLPQWSNLNTSDNSKTYLVLFAYLYYFRQDARSLHLCLSRRAYTLAIADILYGLAMRGCLDDDSIVWGETKIQKLVQLFGVITTSKICQCIIIHSLDQYHLVKVMLEDECNSRIQSHV